MAEKYITELLGTVLATRSRPGVTFWNRLEGRPRAEAFDRALRAEVRDPLWMLTRQWQIGEFRGDDAGSPITAKIQFETTRIRQYRPGDPARALAVEPFDDATPLEARVEQLPAQMTLDLRVLMGRYWLKLIGSLGAAARAGYLLAYPVKAADPTDPAQAPITAHAQAWSAFAAAAGRLMDGYGLYAHLAGGGAASDGVAAVAGQKATVDALGLRFTAWFDQLIYQPTQPSAWEPDRLEYQFGCAAPAGTGSPPKVLRAQEYYHGHLDWYNLDVETSRSALDPALPLAEAPVTQTFSALPTTITFNGMPNTRWWAFEDNRTNFGDVKPDTTDLAKLLLIEFGLVYANDWFGVPVVVPAGSITTVRGLAVTNVFGERTWVEAAGRGEDADWQRWAMYLMSVAGAEHRSADLSLAILPAAQKVLEGRPLDDITFTRDEMANMVWGIEKTIPLPSGPPAFGAEAARDTRGWFLRRYQQVHGAPPTPPPAAEDAHIRYQVMSSVPEQWIPMIPVHRDGDTREIQLQRAAMLRLIDGDTEENPIRPRTWLLRQGLDDPAGPPAPYYLHEEEVPRAGVRVTRAYQRTRWRDGRVWVWLGARKQTGRGEGSSGLAFDRIVDLR